MTKLVIVESPAKARKIGGFLGDEYVGGSISRPYPRSATEGRRYPGRI
jgi:hypothetical protein